MKKEFNQEKTYCALCKKEANKTGSHIISHSIIKKAINYKGSILRHKESSFSTQLGSNLKVGYYGGQSLLPEQREEELQKVNQNIENLSENPDTEDYIFCDACEKRFTGIEEYFSGKILNTLEAFTINQSKRDLSEILVLKEFTKSNENAIIKLFFLIQLWRASVSKTKDFKLKAKFEERLRKALLLLSSDVRNINFQSIHELLCDFSMAIVYMKNAPNSDTTNNVVELNPNLNLPYFAILNQFVVIMYEKKQQSGGILSELLGLGSCKNIKDILSTGLIDSIKIGFLNNTQRELLLENFYRECVHFQINSWINKVKYLHRRIFSEQISELELAQIKFKANIVEEDSWENMGEKIFQSTQKFIFTKISWYKTHNIVMYDKIVSKIQQL